jgi:hypothetical protein
MIKRERDIADAVGRTLKKAGIAYDREVDIGGTRADFVVHALGNRRIIVDVKAWKQFDGFRNRAAHQVALYRKALKADAAFIVVDGLKRSSIQDGVVTVEKLVAAIQAAASGTSRPRAKSKTMSTSRRGHVFAAMPFAAKYDDVYFVAMTYAAEQAHTTCLRADKMEYSGDIVAEIQKLIRSSAAVIADLSEASPNVLYEAGYAHALNKPTIHICSTPLGELPFNVGHWNTIPYTPGQTHQLRPVLARRLREAVAPRK